jgi:hypothetical protein
MSFLEKTEILCYVFQLPDLARLCPAPSRRRASQLGHSVTWGKIFFIWIRCNPLKGPDPAKGIQGNPSLFPWFYLHLLAFIWPPDPSQGRLKLREGFPRTEVGLGARATVPRPRNGLVAPEKPLSLVLSRAALGGVP